MSRARYLLWRVVGLFGSVWAVFTFVFLFYMATPTLERTLFNPEAGFGVIGGEGLPAEAGAPPLEQYLDWLAWLLSGPEPAVVDPVVEALGYTVAYLVPSLAVAVVVGTAVRMVTVFSDRTWDDPGVDAVTVVGVSVPVFLLAFMLQHWFLTDFFEYFGTTSVYVTRTGPFGRRNLLAAAWPGAAMTVYLLAIQLRYAGEELREYANAEFVKTARAKGAGTLRVGRHVFRNTAIGLLTVFLTDMYGMVVVGVFAVEFVAATPGISRVMIEAVVRSDLKLILVVSVLSVSVGVVATFLQDVAYMLYDPRVDVGD